MKHSLFSLLLVLCLSVFICAAAEGGTTPYMLIGNLGTSNAPQYALLAEFIVPDGYRLNPDDSTSIGDYMKNMYLYADDPAAVVQTICVAAVPGKTPAEMIALLKEKGEFIIADQPEIHAVSGIKASCYFGVSQATDAQRDPVPGQGSAGLYIYLETVSNSSCLMALVTGNAPYAALPSAIELLQAAESFLPGLSIYK